MRENSVYKPWGWYQVLAYSDTYKVKLLYVTGGHRLSLQKHKYRNETWTVIEGNPKVTLDSEVYELKPTDTIFISKETVHRIEATDSSVFILELQQGICDEEDIVRLEDDYDR